MPRLSQRAEFWSTKSVPLSGGTRRGRRGCFQTPGEPISRDQILTITESIGEDLAWDCQRHDALVVHPIIGCNTFQIRDSRRRCIVRNRKGFDGDWLEILEQDHHSLGPKREISGPLCSLCRSLPRGHPPNQELSRLLEKPQRQVTHKAKRHGSGSIVVLLSTLNPLLILRGIGKGRFVDA